VDPGIVACTQPAPKFAVTGAGVVRADSSVVLADGAAGTVVRYTNKGARLVAGKTLPAGPGAHGNLLTFRDRLYVPIQRGLAVVDLTGKAKPSVIRLPTSPAAIWISPTGRLFATLPAENAVAFVDLASARPAPQYVPVGKRPQGVAGIGGTVYVANTAERTLTLLSVATGRAVGDPRKVGVLRAPVVPQTVATSIAHKASTDGVVFTVAFSGPALARRDVITTQAAIRSGLARLVLWREGARARVSRASAGGASLQLGAAYGRLALVLKAKPKAFISVAVSLAAGGHKLVIALRPAPVAVPPAPAPTPPSPSPSPSPSPTPTPPSPSPSPNPPNPPPPPPPPIGIG
jgi:hypothetical protein